jgi:hypothetical protein
MLKGYSFRLLVRKQIQRPDDNFLFLFLRFGFTEYQLLFIWQSEIVQMAFRNYMKNVIDQDTLYCVVYHWLTSNKNTYINRKFQLHVYNISREEEQPVERCFCEPQNT